MMSMKYKIYLISLKKDENRRQRLKKLFKNYDDFIVIDAISSKEMSTIKYYESLIKSYKKAKRIISPAELGCSLSHMRVYEEFLKNDSDYALIFEDDVIGDEIGIKKAFESIKALKNDNFVIILGGEQGVLSFDKAFGKKINDNLIKISKYSLADVARTVCYIVSKTSAKKILEYQKNALCIADEWEKLLGENDIECYYSDIFAHASGQDSSIENERELKSSLMPRKIKRKLSFKLFSLIDRFQSKLVKDLL